MTIPKKTAVFSHSRRVGLYLPKLLQDMVTERLSTSWKALPAAMNDKAEIRVIEPYAHGQFTESKASPFEGRSHVHWLTGTASTVMVGCVEGICGMRPDLEGLVIAPSIPSEWDGFTIEKTFRGKQLSIDIQNPDHVQSGVSEITLNGEKLEDNYVPAEKLADVNKITVIMG